MCNVVCYAEQKERGNKCRENKPFGNIPSWISTPISLYSHFVKMQHYLASSKFIERNRIQSFYGREKGYKTATKRLLKMDKMFTFLKI